jgi:hypothetical protein
MRPSPAPAYDTDRRSSAPTNHTIGDHVAPTVTKRKRSEGATTLAALRATESDEEVASGKENDGVTDADYEAEEEDLYD